jgi:hypothetical protein
MVAASLGIGFFCSTNGCFPRVEALKVCAEAIAPGPKRPAVPTSGYCGRPPAANLSFIGLAARIYPLTASSAAAAPRGGEKCGLTAR